MSLGECWEPPPEDITDIVGGLPVSLHSPYRVYDKLATMSGPFTPALTGGSTLFEILPQSLLTTAEAAGLIVYQNRVDWWGAFTVQYRGRWPVARPTTHTGHKRT